MSTMPQLDLAKYRLVLQPRETLSLPPYKGSTFRGAFGTVFRRVACMCGANVTEHQPRCFYSHVFETPRDASLADLPQTAQMPHPFVLEPPLEDQRIYTPEDQLAVHLILMGQAIEWLPYFVFSFEELGRLGIGARRGKTRLLEVASLAGAEAVPVFSGTDRQFLSPGQPVTVDTFWQSVPLVASIDVEFHTPARLVSKGRLRHELEFSLLFGALLRRLALLMMAHGGGGSLTLPTGHPIDAIAILRYFFDRHAQRPEDRRALLDAFDLAANVNVETQHLRWHDWERYSNRQQTRMTLGGVLGRVRYVGELGPFLPYLRLGELIHVGKNSAFGLGQITAEVVA